MDFEEVSYEPMDIDLSSNSVRNCSINESVTNSDNTAPKIAPIKREVKIEKEDELSQRTEPQKPNINISVKRKRHHVRRYKIRIEKGSNQGKTHKAKSAIVICIFVILTSILLAVYLNDFNCIDHLNLTVIEESLSKLYGQENAVNDIVTSLKVNYNRKILFFHGGTGVGKTYATSLMFENLWKFSNVYHFTKSKLQENEMTEQLLLGFLLCKSTILVIDDLTSKDVEFINTAVSNFITKSEDLNKNLTVILLFNCDNVAENFEKKCDMNFPTVLKEMFKDIDVYKKFIKFKQLTQVELVKCVEKELGNRKVDKKEMSNILKNFNVSLDGCKGVYTKIKFYNMI